MNLIDKIKAGYTITTSDGHPVRILITDAKSNQPIVGLVQYPEDEQCEQWSIDGKYLEEDGDFDTHYLDLQAEEPDWFVIYDKQDKAVSVRFDSLKEAQAARDVMRRPKDHKIYKYSVVD